MKEETRPELGDCEGRRDTYQDRDSEDTPTVAKRPLGKVSGSHIS